MSDAAPTTAPPADAEVEPEGDWRAAHTGQLDTINKMLEEVMARTAGVIATDLQWKLEGIKAQLDQVGRQPLSIADRWPS